MTPQDIKTGDSFLIKGTSFISRIICKVMVKWGKKKGYNTDLIYSHAGRFVWIAGDLYIYGSIDSGYKPWIFKDHYDWDKDTFCIMRRKQELSPIEENRTINYVQHLVTVSLAYQYWNFVKWLLLVYVNIDWFNKTSDDFTYCYQSEYMCRRDLNPETHKEDYQVDIFELLYDPNYEIIYKSLK
jgi:hypothetical protein